MTARTTWHGGRTMTRRGKQALFVAIVAATILLPADADGILPLPPPSASAVPDGPGGGGGLPSPRGRSLRDGISRFRGRDLTTRRRGGHDDVDVEDARTDARTDAHSGGRQDPGREGGSKEGIVASDEAVGLKPVLSPPTRPRPTRPTRPGQQQQVSFKFGTDSCVGSCDGNAGDCWCDNLCFTTYNDCCDDACQVCPCKVCGADGPCSHSECKDGDGYCGTPPPPSPPDAPTNLAAAPLAGSQVGFGLTWSAASTGSAATGFSIHRRTDTGSFAEIGQITDGTTTTYDDVETLAAGTYHYAVRATNDGGESPLSNEASVTVGPPPEAQLSCVPAATGGSSSVVQGGSGDWTCTVTSLNGYTNTLTPSCDSSTTPSGITCAFFQESISVPADGTVDTTLTVSVGDGVSPSAYDLQVDASDGGSAAVEASATVSVSVTAAPSSEPSGSPSSGPSSAPSSGPSGSPSSLLSQPPSESAVPSASPSSQPSSDPSSMPSGSPSSGPSLAPSSEPSGSPSALHSQPPSESVVPSASPSSDPSSDPSSMPSGSPSSGPSLAPSSEPSGSPSALHSQPPSESVVPSEAPSSDPSSDPSSMPSGSPSGGPSSGPSGTPVPDAPGNLVATLVGGDRVELTWGEPPSGTPQGGYKVHRRDDVGGGLVEIGQVSGGTTTAYSDTNLPGPGTYHYAVAAVNSAGVEGALSDEASVTWDPPPTCTDQVAVHDGGLGAPACSTVGCSCDSGVLLVGREDNGPEPNQPNTLDACADGGSGDFHIDESLDRIVVRSTDGGFIRAGSTVDIVATVYAWSTYTADSADFYHALDASSPAWTLIETVVATQSGLHNLTLTQPYTLPDGGGGSSTTTQQAIRVNFRYNSSPGSPGNCTDGSWDDRDDLVFAVAAAAECTANGDCPAGSVCGAGGVCSSSRPSSSPSGDPSASPSSSPSVDPSTLPSVSPSASFVPSHQPSSSPSSAPSPTTPSPTTPSPTDCQDESGLELSTGFVCGGDRTCDNIETYGIMFDVDTEGSSLSVDAFDLNIEKDAPEVQVWARPGTHEGFEFNSSGWTQIGPTYFLDGQDSGSPTRLTLSESVPINGRHAFYFLQTDDDDIELQYYNSWTLDTIQASDDKLKIYVGTRKDDEDAFDPNRENQRGHGFSGTIIYTDLCSPTTSAQPSMEPSSTIPTPPTPLPSLSPTITPPPGLSPPPTGGTITYTPGDIANGIKEAGLLLSKGLRARKIAVAENPVVYDIGGQSSRDFHIMPDGAGIFQDPNNPDCYSYVSNSEVRSDEKLGGVGAIILCGADVIEYKWLLENTERNCGGGKTPHGTWLSGEEVGDGSIWEVHPFGDPIFNGLAYQETKMSYTTSGEEDFDKFESIAVDNRNPNFPVYYITVDSSDGELRRWEPNSTIVSQALVDNDHTAVLANVGTVDYLILSGGSSGGTYSWTTNKQDAINSAVAHYQNPEGIEFDDKSGKLFFTAKVLEALFILDIDSDTYERVIPGTDGHPDQIKLICSVTDDDESLLYFAEDGGDRGIHARTPDGSFYEIILGEDYSGDESSGVAFSPDKMYMYFAMQDHGTIFQIWRDDLRPFSGAFNQLSDTAKEALAAAQAASTAAKEPDTRNPDMLTPITVASDDFGNATIQPGFQTSMTTSKFDAISGEKDDVTQAVFSTRVGGRHRRPRPN